jgi:hypothetical protein
MLPRVGFGIANSAIAACNFTSTGRVVLGHWLSRRALQEPLQANLSDELMLVFWLAGSQLLI